MYAEYAKTETEYIYILIRIQTLNYYSFANMRFIIVWFVKGDNFFLLEGEIIFSHSSLTKGWAFLFKVKETTIFFHKKMLVCYFFLS